MTKARKNSRGGRASRSKGNRVERLIVERHLDAGITAERVPLSGSARGSFCDDVLVTPHGRSAPLRLEVKARRTRSGIGTVFNWLGGSDALAIKVDREAPVFVVPERVWIELLQRTVDDGRPQSKAPSGVGPSPALSSATTSDERTLNARLR